MKLILCLISFSLFASLYKMQDLQFLYDEKNYNEFFKHATDILPSQRGANWQNMVSTLGRDYLKQSIQTQDYSHKNFFFIEEIYQWPILREDPEFNLNRIRYGSEYFARCEKQQCEKNLISFWNFGTKSLNQTQTLVAMLKEKSLINDELYLKLITQHLQRDQDAKICENRRTFDLVFSGFENYFKNTKAYENPLKTLSQACQNKFHSYLETKVKSPLYNNAKLAYHFNNHLKQPVTSINDVYELRFFLSEFKKGKTLNKSWFIIESLGQSNEKRQNVLKQMSDLDPLPDQLFSHPNEKEKNIMIDHLANNFPEYMDHYAKQCLKFLKGQMKFPNGNPTIHCQELVKHEKSNKWIEASLVEKIKESLLF